MSHNVDFWAKNVYIINNMSVIERIKQLRREKEARDLAKAEADQLKQATSEKKREEEAQLARQMLHEVSEVFQKINDELLTSFETHIIDSFKPFGRDSGNEIFLAWGHNFKINVHQGEIEKIRDEESQCNKITAVFIPEKDTISITGMKEVKLKNGQWKKREALEKTIANAYLNSKKEYPQYDDPNYVFEPPDFPG